MELQYGWIAGYQCRKEGNEWIRSFDVVDNNDNVYRCITSLYLPIMDTDMIVFNEPVKLTEQNTLNVYPYARPDPRVSLSSYFDKALKRYPAVRLEVYQHLKSKAPKKYETIEENIVHYVEELVRRRDNGESIKLPFKPEVVDALLSWFRTNVSVRRFKLLGLNNEQVRAVFTSHNGHPRDIYERIIVNPYLAYACGSKACEQICRIVRIAPSELQKRIGEEIIRLYSYVTDKGWTCIEQSLISPDILPYRDFLVSEFNIHWLGNFMYFPLCWEVESGLARWFREQSVKQPLFKELPITIDNEEQCNAIKEALSYPIATITGEAGTGKTTLIAHLIKALIASDVKYWVCSFTGKAVQRARQVTKTLRDADEDSLPFSTIHRLINKLSQAEKPVIEYLIIDEVSMVSMLLLYALTCKLPSNIQVLMVGDPNQLEPIDFGHTLEVILNTSKIHHVKLVTNHRQGDNGITINTRRILNSQSVDNEDGFALIMCKNEEIYGHVSGIAEFCHENLPDDKLMIVCPYTKHLERINEDVRPILRNQQYGDGSLQDAWKNTFYLGDHVILTENDNEGLIFNGDEGEVVMLEGNAITVKWYRTGTETKFSTTSDFYQEEVSLSIYGGFSARSVKSTRQLQVAYGITCHKSQGSEWDIVIIALPWHPRNPEFINKRMIYTAITRARKCCYVVGDIKTLQQACRTPNAVTSTLLPYLIDHGVER